MTLLGAAIILVLNAYPNDPRGAYDICVEKLEMKCADQSDMPCYDFYVVQEACEYVVDPYLEPVCPE